MYSRENEMVYPIAIAPPYYVAPDAAGAMASVIDCQGTKAGGEVQCFN